MPKPPVPGQPWVGMVPCSCTGSPSRAWGPLPRHSDPLPGHRDLIPRPWHPVLAHGDPPQDPGTLFPLHRDFIPTPPGAHPRARGPPPHTPLTRGLQVVAGDALPVLGEGFQQVHAGLPLSTRGPGVSGAQEPLPAPPCPSPGPRSPSPPLAAAAHPAGSACWHPPTPPRRPPGTQPAPPPRSPLPGPDPPRWLRPAEGAAPAPVPPPAAPR